MNTIPFTKEATEITKDKIEQIIKENTDYIGFTVTVELLRDVLSVIKGLQTENKIIMDNNAELDKQRTDFAMKIEELRLENNRLKEQFRWIPVSERMPEFPGWYLVSGNGDVWFAEYTWIG